MVEHGDDLGVWNEAMGDTGVEDLGCEFERDYPITPEDEIREVEESELVGMEIFAPLLMRSGNRINEKARELAETIERSRRWIEWGWSMGIHTTGGSLGLLHKDRNLALTFPEGVVVYEELIMEMLGVQRGEPVPYAYRSMSDFDKDKEIETDGYERPWGFKTREIPVLWSSFCTPRMPNGGRVWIEYSMLRNDVPDIRGDVNGRNHVSCTNIPGVDPETGDLTHARTFNKEGYWSIATYFYDLVNEHSPDAPTKHPKAIVKVANGFWHLAAVIAMKMGEPQSLTVDFGSELIMVPENLMRECEEFDVYLAKSRYVREMQRYRGTQGENTLFLTEDIDVSPWVLARHMPLPEVMNPEDLVGWMIRSTIV